MSRSTEPQKLPPLDIEPHPYCGCEHCRENYYPNGSPRHDSSGNPIPASDTEAGELVERTT